MDVLNGQCCRHTNSRIFDGYKSIGHVSNHIPLVRRYIHRRKENFIVTCIGKSFTTYASDKLKILSVSKTLGEDICCMVADTYHVYTAAGPNIYAWRRGTELKHIYEGQGSKITHMLPFGEFLLSIADDGDFCMWDIKLGECLWTVTFDCSTFKPSAIMHPHSYLNKILIGSNQGSLQLWNIRTTKKIFEMEGWSSQIVALVQSPAKDTVAVALANCNIVLHDILYNTTLFTLKCMEKPLTLAFRTDGPPILIVGGVNGTISLWDLEKKAIISMMENAHQGPVTGMECFIQEPVFVTSSPDNSVKIWIMDKFDGGARLLNSREGHQQPSNRIRFHGTKGYNILSAGQDSSFRVFHIHNETYNRCLSKKKPTNKTRKDFGSKEMPSILDFTTESVANPNHYDDVAACHNGHSNLSTWSINNTKQSETILALPSKSDATATCLCMTSCSQFVIAGYDNGDVHRFNIQSHKHRKNYGPHSNMSAVTGVAVDHTNTTVLSGGSDATLKFWDFKTGELLYDVTLDAGVTFIFSHRTTNLVGVAVDNFSIVIVDLLTSNIVRNLSNMSDVILDAKFSPNCSWVTASTADCLVRTWDLSTSRMIDIFRTEEIIRSLDYSPNGEFLATTVSDNVGIILWSNKTLFSHISLMPIPLDFEPNSLDSDDMSTIMEVDKDSVGEDDTDLEYESPMQISENLITLSLLPDSKWKSLHLDQSRLRNQTSQSANPVVVPFFIDNFSDNATDKNNDLFANDSVTDKPSKPVSKISQISLNMTPFGEKLMQENKNLDDYVKLCQMLGDMGPSNIDLVIRSLGVSGGGSVSLLREFMKFMIEIIKTNKFYEGSHAYLFLFLKIHGDFISTTEDLRAYLTTLHAILKTREYDFNTEISSMMAYIVFLKGTTL